MAFDDRALPDDLAGVGVARLDPADDAELAARHAGDDLALDDHRRGRVAVAGLEVVDVFLPDDLAGLLVEGDELGVEGAEDHLVLVERGAAVHDVAAGQDALGQAGVVFPELLAGARIDRVDARVRAGDVDDAVLHQRLALLAALLLAAEGERPGRDQVDGVAVDGLQGL